MIRKWLAVVWLAIASTSAAAADRIERVEPASWWVGMQDDRLQLLVHGDRVAQCGQQGPGDRRHHRRGAVTLVTLPAGTHRRGVAPAAKPADRITHWRTRAPRGCLCRQHGFK